MGFWLYKLQFNRKGQYSIFNILIVPFMILLVLEMVFVIISLTFGGVFSMSNQNARNSLERQLLMRAEELQDDMQTSWSTISNLTFTINQVTEGYLSSGMISYDSLGKPGHEVGLICNEIADELVDEMYSKQVSGIFVIFDTDDYSDKGAERSTELPGICIRDLDPKSEPTTNYRDLLLERSPVEVVRSNKIATDNIWKPYFSEKDGIMEKAVPELLESVYINRDQGFRSHRFGFWTPETYYLDGDKKEYFAYIEPLILDDGSIYGVVGVEISNSYIQEILPYRELNSSDSSEYLLITQSGNSENANLVALSAYYDDKERFAGADIYCKEDNPGVTSVVFDVPGTAVVAEKLDISRDSDIYGTSNNDEWFLIAATDKSELYSTTRHLFVLIFVVALLTLILGIAGILLVSRTIAAPIRRLEETVKASGEDGNMPRFESTGIREIDSFASAITVLSRETEKERDYDLLTELYGRRAFKRVCSSLMPNTELMKNAAFFVIDLDNLKGTNDTYGHNAGDLYIMTAAKAFVESLPDQSICSRNAGDEFAILSYGYESQEDVLRAARMLNHAVQTALVALPGGKSLSLSASIGVSRYPQEGTDYAALFEKADKAMYHVKKTGKGDLCFFYDLALFNDFT